MVRHMGSRKDGLDFDFFPLAPLYLSSVSLVKAFNLSVLCLHLYIRIIIVLFLGLLRGLS